MFIAVAVFLFGVSFVPSLVQADTSEETYSEALSAINSAELNLEVREAYAGSNEAAATRVRKAFLQAKKAFHEARQQIAAIKKGDENPAKDLPCFFSCDEEGEENDDDYQEDEGPEIQEG